MIATIPRRSSEKIRSRWVHHDPRVLDVAPIVVVVVKDNVAGEDVTFANFRVIVLM
jgi:hypothetical protein